MRAQTTRCKLTERDLSLLEWIGVCSGADLPSAYRHFWHSAGKPVHAMKAADRRLRLLTRAGYLRCGREPCIGRVFYLTQEGAAKLKADQRLHLQLGPGPDNARQQSRLLAAAVPEIEKQVQSSGGRVIYWRAERELRAAASGLSDRHDDEETFIPDAQAVIERPDGRLEYLNIEIVGDYYGQNMKRKLRKLEESRQATLWCCSPKRVAYLRSRLSESRYAKLLVIEKGADR